MASKPMPWMMIEQMASKTMVVPMVASKTMVVPMVESRTVEPMSSRMVE
jgi:hypothetical protein